MADQYTNYTYAQGNLGEPGGDSSGNLSDLGVNHNDWPAQTLNYSQLTNCDDYTGRKFAPSGAASWPDGMQPTGPAIDPTGVQKTGQN
jgi:hypothetical protein